MTQNSQGHTTSPVSTVELLVLSTKKRSCCLETKIGKTSKNVSKRPLTTGDVNLLQNRSGKPHLVEELLQKQSLSEEEKGEMKTTCGVLSSFN